MQDRTQTNEIGWSCPETSNSSTPAVSVAVDKRYSRLQFGKIKAIQYYDLILTEFSIVSEALSSTKYMPHFPAGKKELHKDT